ncbi:EAL domain-containing protein [Sphaerotilus sp.]|uniref:EAL domain-containing protein n=1 Tax=Sphaerotilus sp. TaxID=2093942 RepID=UPI00286D9F8C|nr:EAL domain-containing protein [Sphaerotilus sp.]
MPFSLPRFSFAFQPIVHAPSGTVVSYEALIRGPEGESAHSVLSGVPQGELHEFDAHGREVAIALAARLGIRTQLNLNFLPQSLFSQRDVLTPMFEAASLSGLPISRLVLEVTEGEVIDDVARFARLIKTYRAQGLKLAIDDFGAGYCGLNLLAEFQPDILKLDMALLRGIERSGPRQAIVRAILSACTDLGIDAIAEGVETVDEFSWLADEGVTLFQGYLFARPGFEALPGVAVPPRR